MLRAEDIHYHYGTNTVLRGVSVLAASGKITCIIGPNAAGKTTLLKILAGILHPSRGHVYVEGNNLFNLSRKARAQLVRYICFYNELPHPMKVKHFLLLSRIPLRGLLQPFTENDIRTVENAAEELKIIHLLERDFNHLSQGEKARVAFATALVGKSHYILFDEVAPFMDIRASVAAVEVIKKLRASGKAIVFVTQDLSTALSIADTVYVLSGHKIIFSGTPDELVGTHVLEHAFQVKIHVHRSPEGHYHIVAEPPK